MNTKNGFSTLLTVLITAVTVGVLTGVISYSYAASKKDLEIEDLKEQLSQTSATPSTETTDEMANWKTYTNNKYGFSFRYPEGWILNDNPSTISNKIYIADPILQKDKNFDQYITGRMEGVGGHPGQLIRINLVNSDKNLDQYYEEQIHIRGESGELFSDRKDILIAGLPSYQYVISNGDKTLEALVRKSNSFIIINLQNSTSEDFFNQILSTFQFTK